MGTSHKTAITINQTSSGDNAGDEPPRSAMLRKNPHAVPLELDVLRACAGAGRPKVGRAARRDNRDGALIFARDPEPTHASTLNRSSAWKDQLRARVVGGMDTCLATDVNRGRSR